MKRFLPLLSFALLISAMWLNSGAFSFGYMAHDGAQRRYYTFYLLTLGALLGMHVFRHKTRHWYFRFGLPLLLLAQAGLGGWLVLGAF